MIHLTTVTHTIQFSSTCSPSLGRPPSLLTGTARPPPQDSIPQTPTNGLDALPPPAKFTPPPANMTTPSPNPPPALNSAGRRLQQVFDPAPNTAVQLHPESVFIGVNGSFTGLKPGSYYHLFLVSEDRNRPTPNQMATSQQFIVHTDKQTPPSCKLSCGTSTSSAISIVASLDQAGTLYYSIQRNSTYVVPTLEQVCTLSMLYRTTSRLIEVRLY